MEHRYAYDSEIAAVHWQGKFPVAETAELLVEQALQKGGRDNITVILCELAEQEQNWFGKLLSYFL